MKLLNNQTYKPSYFWLLMALLALLLLVRLGATPIYILDEAKNAQCAREMLQRGDWIVPTFNNELRTDKPPLHYFFMMAAYSMFGVNEFAARFFSAVMGLLTVLVTYLYTKKHTNAFTAFCSASVLILSTHFLFEFRLAVPDPYLIFFITLGLFASFTWLQYNNTSQLFLAAMALGLATLAKGPVALALPGLCLLVWIVVKRKWSTLFTWKLVPAFLLLCIVVLPWYWAVYKATNGAWIKGFFIDHNLNRFSDPQEGHGGLFFLTILFVVAGLLPFSSFIAEVVKKRSVVKGKEIVQFAVVVVAAFVIFFSISSTKLPNYPMPCYAFAAIILGNFIAALCNGLVTSKRYPLYILLFITLLIPVAGYFAIQQEAEAKAVSNYVLLLLVVPSALAVALFFKNKSWSRLLVYVSIVYTVFNLLLLQLIYPLIYQQNPVAKTIELVKQQKHLFSYVIYNPGYNFYIDTNVQRFDTIDSLKYALQQQPDALVITRKEYVDTLQKINLEVVATHHDLFELPTTVILQYGKP